MATQQDLQELLRLLTVSRKIPMMQAMTQIKALQAVELRSIKQIAESPLETVESAIKDEKAARSLQSACKAVLKRGDQLGGVAGSKRAADAPGTGPSSKRIARQQHQDTDGFMRGGPVEMTPQELESSLELPISTDEARIAETVLQTNRAPLVLAFAVELLRHTMPEQPLSSRLSLGQAVVSANSRSKAVSLGLEKGASADDEGWGAGQPRVRVMGREVAVLKRGGYEWRGEETVGDEQDEKTHVKAETQTQTLTQGSTATSSGLAQQSTWAVGQPISLKSSAFVARAISITDASQRKSLLESLLEANPNLKTATHNAWAYRLRPPEGFLKGRGREESFDDGESGCGDLMLKVMREVDAVDTLVVLTRWFGGVFLGPDRWRIMRNCVTGALSERLRKTGIDTSLGGEAVWGLDLEGTRTSSSSAAKNQHQSTGVVGMQIHRPETARNYLLKSFMSAPEEQAGAGTSPSSPAKKTQKKPTQKALDLAKEENLGLLLGALRLVFDSWADHLTTTELDRRAWAWYVAVRPAVDSGPSGWGAKGTLRLRDILDLRRKES
ncbi:hypothetical protein B0T19DRAFT_414695 [Cercophora scortea]|uniref:Impact N-terminal domain-containing protein n=1 Tax=Cercophora scortea TaxID=314031 RepID=A0AAE0IVL4_9PEZI|nr:hypothetical protein B0T19DRAFT_414695 [Cercophora scortea]